MTIFVEFAGRRVRCWLVKRAAGEKPRECLAWRDGWVSFQASVVLVGRISAGANELAVKLKRIGYTQVQVEEGQPAPEPEPEAETGRTRK